MPLKINCTHTGDAGSHTHASFSQLQACAMGHEDDMDVILNVRVTRTRIPVERPPTDRTAPASGIVIRRPTDPASLPQLRLIERLGGSWRDMKANGSKGEASTTIDMLRDTTTAAMFKLPKSAPVMGGGELGEPIEDERWELFPVERGWRLRMPAWSGPEWDYLEPPAEPEKPSYTPPPVPDAKVVEPAKPTSRTILEKMAPLLDGIDDGYYAVESLDGKTRFYRLSRPKKGEYRGCLKVQSIHGANLDTDWIRYPSGHISVYRPRTEDDILLIIGDYMGASRRYAREKSKCCKCGTNLTDDRSRKYGIGPECEKQWPHIIEMVDLELAAEAEMKRGG